MSFVFFFFFFPSRWSTSMFLLLFGFIYTHTHTYIYIYIYPHSFRSLWQSCASCFPLSLSRSLSLSSSVLICFPSSWAGLCALVPFSYLSMCLLYACLPATAVRLDLFRFIVRYRLPPTISVYHFFFFLFFFFFSFFSFLIVDSPHTHTHTHTYIHRYLARHGLLRHPFLSEEGRGRGKREARQKP